MRMHPLAWAEEVRRAAETVTPSYNETMFTREQEEGIKRLRTRGCPVEHSHRQALREKLAAAMAAAAVDAPRTHDRLGECSDLGQFGQVLLECWGIFESKAMARHLALIDPAELVKSGRLPAVALQIGASDLREIYTDAIGKVILDSWKQLPSLWPNFCAEASSPRFDGLVTSIDPIVGLLEQKEGSEVRDLSRLAGDYGVNVMLKQFSGVVSADFQALIGDDLSVLGRSAQRLGSAASLLEDSEVFNLLAQNSGYGPALKADGLPLFNAAHGNIVGPSALTAANLDVARAALAAQTTKGQARMNLKVRTLLVPVALASVAGQVLEEIGNASAATEDKIRLVIAPHVDDVIDATTWYGFADTAIAPVLSVMFLTGQRAPQIVSRFFDFPAPMARWRVSHCIGVGAIGYQGGVVNRGA